MPRREPKQADGKYRTKQIILEIYHEIAEVIRTGKPYRTRLDPPPADPPRCSSAPRAVGCTIGEYVNEGEKSC